MTRARAIGSSVVWLCALQACDGNALLARAAGPAPAQESTTAPAVAAPAPLAGRMVRIAAGNVRVGSRPGAAGRDPGAEADWVPLELGEFEIDRLPYPNDSAQRALTGVARARASELCAEQGKRLCHELEWERACAGVDGDVFVTGDTLDLASCAADPSACASSEGVADLGVRVREWTASDFDANGAAVVRGATPSDAPAAHRCAARVSVAATESQAQLGFRCCRGTAPAPAYPATRGPHDRGARALDAPVEAVRSALASVPSLAALAQDFTPFTTADVEAALRKGKRSRDSITVWQIQPAAFAWSPVAGEELHVVSGRAKDQAVLAVLYPLSDGTYVHAASTIVSEPDATFAMGYSNSTPDQLLFTTCYGCPAESGTLRYEADGRVSLTLR